MYNQDDFEQRVMEGLDREAAEESNKQLRQFAEKELRTVQHSIRLRIIFCLIIISRQYKTMLFCPILQDS